MKTDRVIHCYRIASGRHAIYDDEGSRRYPSRWNTKNSPVIYAAEHYSTAMLEKLVHASGIMPANQHYIEITIQNGTSCEFFQSATHPGWDDEDEQIAKKFGDGWRRGMRSAILFVPSIPARLDRNVIINRDHPDAASISHSMAEPVWWDERLFG